MRLGSKCPTSCNNALTLFAVNYLLLEYWHTPSPGGKHRQEERLWGPVQRRRECGTLYVIARAMQNLGSRYKDIAVLGRLISFNIVR